MVTVKAEERSCMHTPRLSALPALHGPKKGVGYFFFGLETWERSTYVADVDTARVLAAGTDATLRGGGVLGVWRVKDVLYKIVGIVEVGS